jgi:hypothetical protein
MASHNPSTTSLDRIPLSPRARKHYETVFKPRLEAMRAEIAQTTLTILIWGPGPSNKELYAKRLQIRDELRQCDHAAFTSEELAKTKPFDYSQKAIEFIQASAADLVVVLAASFGSVAEVHDFGDCRVINSKMLIFISDEATDGYSYQGALTELKTAYNSVETFHAPDDIVSCHLKAKVLQKVAVLQMLKWRATKNAISWG